MSKSGISKASPKIKSRGKRQGSVDLRPDADQQSEDNGKRRGPESDGNQGDDSSGSDAESVRSANDPANDEGLALPHGSASTWQRPSGFDLRDYSCWERWSNRRWAWEFLRRDCYFQKGCVDKAVDPLELCARFHLSRFKHFSDEYEQPRKAQFRVGVRSYPRRKTFAARLALNRNDSARFTTLLTPSEVLIKFQLAPTKGARNTSIACQCRQAKKRLEALADLLRAEKKKEGEDLALKVYKFERFELIKALRAIDLQRTKGLSIEEIGHFLMEGEAETEETLDTKEADGIGRRALFKGKGLRDGGYLMVAMAKVGAFPTPT